MNLTGQTVAQKPPKAKPRPDYLLAVRMLPCCICEAFGGAQTIATQAHHPICGRHSTRKTPDIMAIPLCEGHHQGDFDTSKVAIHRDREEWVRQYGADTDWIAPTQDKLAHLLDCHAYRVDE